ncbi:PAS domain-containing protein [Neorhizobium sp. P12A]|jgi:PAS domain S-box-containing protein|uniref:PAS domain-containing protein n=1 Tax=Neorhizobium sp. P12A TaxID=2268027 RepID=UPI001FEFD90C|nr:PAS domain-containing protein [Neorhizobium sp. P12A]
MSPSTATNPSFPLHQASSFTKKLSTVAFERTRMPMVLTDARQPNYPMVIANQAFLDLTGYAADELLGHNCRMLQGEGTSPAAIAEIRHAVAGERDVDVELLNYRKDGTPFWNQLHLSPIFDDGGQIAYYFGSQIDVTAYRKVQALEASEHRLLMEVDHRAKNVLAIVDSIVRLSNTDNAAAYASAVQQRVHSLVQAHALLSSEAWQAVDIRKIVEAQISRYVGSNISLTGPVVLVSPKMVQPLSLIIHELAVNALTHGSLSRPGEGRLLITWASGTGSEDDRLHFSWDERGGKPAARNAGGFGTVILGALIEKR